MPRTSSPNIPEAELIEKLQAEIDCNGWQTVRNQVIEQYQQNLQKIQQSGLSEAEISKKRLKKLSKEELTALALCFKAHLIELQAKGHDTEEKIRQVCLDETELLEKGYPKATIAKNHYPLYINLIRHAISTQQLVLNQQNSYLIPIPDKDTGELTDTRTHYAQLYLKYDDLFYLHLKRSVTANNNVKQDLPKPVVLPLYLVTVNYLLNSQSYPELAAGIAAASGRRFSELIKGHFSLPQNNAGLYELFFEGQLKKKEVAEAYLTYSIVPASTLLEAIARFYSIPKIQSLKDASIRQINDAMNAAVNYQVKRHFQDSKIVSVLEGESRVTIQNLRGIYGEIATHFFCPNRASFPRFLSSQLGHLINDEAIDNSNSPSTEHYFHYYLVDEDNKQIDSVGILIDKFDSALKNYSTVNKVNASQNQPPVTLSATISNLSTSVIERFQNFQGKNMSENDALVLLMEKAEKTEKLEQELKNDDAVIHGLTTKLNSAVERAALAEELEQKLHAAQTKILSLETKLDSAMKQTSRAEELEQKLRDAYAQISSLETKLDSLVKNNNQQVELLLSSSESASNSNIANSTNDAVSLLIRSMSALTSKFDLFLDRQLLTEAQSQSKLLKDYEDSTPTTSASQHSMPSSTSSEKKDQQKTSTTTSGTTKPRKSRQQSALETKALFHKAIDIIMAHNDRSENFEDKWYIGINPLKDVKKSQAAITAVIEERKDEIDQHNQKHELNQFHNSYYHRGKGYTDFFDFS